MGKYYQGTDAALYAAGVKVGRVQSWQITGSAEALPTTTQGDDAETYIYGRQSYQGSLSLYYYRDDAGTLEGASLIGAILKTSAIGAATKQRLKLVTGDGSLEFDALIVGVEISAVSGQVMNANLRFNVSGMLVDASMGGP